MIGISEGDIVVTRRSVDGRFVIFIPTDVHPSWPLRFWWVTLDTRSDAHGTVVRFDAEPASDRWTYGS